MKEIKVGEYVKLRDGEITKVEAINEKTFRCKFHKVRCELFIDFIVNHSKNIKDLVQAGDVVIYTINSKFADIEIVREYTDARTLKTELRVGLYSLEQVDIKQILTKEQFESESYKVKEEIK